jgi:hypothetical protein
MRFERLEPHRKWSLIWRIFWNAPVTMHTRARWYHIIHDVLPTNYRLHNIGMAPTDACHKCGGRDILVHPLIECYPGPEQWDWMKTRIAAILFMDKKWIPGHWILPPNYCTATKKRRAILWMLANIAVFRRNITSPRTNRISHISTECLPDVLQPKTSGACGVTSRS